MTPTFAIVFIAAAALILVPLVVAADLLGRARNRCRRPSQLAMLTIALGLAGGLHNAVFIARGAAWGGDGLSGLNVVFALWSTMGVMILWGALRTRRVRLYRAAGAAIIPAPSMSARLDAGHPASAPAGEPARSVPRGATGTVRVVPAMPGADPRDEAPIVRLVYRDDPSPGVPCAPPLAMMRLPPTLRDIVRAAPAVAAPAPATAAPEPGQPIKVTRPQVDFADTLLPDDVLATRTPAARYAGRPMADAIRRTDRVTGTPGSDAVPQFRSSRAWASPAVC